MRQTRGQMWAHGALTVVWLAAIPVAFKFGWLTSIVFVSACSIYANAAGHVAAWEAARSELRSEERHHE